MIHTERAALADDLAGLSPHQWRQPSLGEFTQQIAVAMHDQIGEPLVGLDQTAFGQRKQKITQRCRHRIF